MAVTKAPDRIQRPPEYYRSKRQRLATDGAVKKRYAPTTKVNMHGVKLKWTRYCAYLCTKAEDHLLQSTKEDIMTFLEWMLDMYKRIRKRSAVHVYKRILFQVYRKSAGVDFDKLANEEINDYINGYLTIKYELDSSIKEKPVMDVDDVYLVLHHHWVHDTSVFPDERQRIQLALMILVQAYTATRPRVLAYKKLSKEAIYNHYFGSDEESQLKYAEEWDPKEDDFKSICYRDVNLVLLKNSDGGRDLPAMEMTLRFTKGWERRENPKTFIFYEVDTFLLDAILLFLSLALLDNAFAAELRSVEDFYKIRVRAPRRSLEFDWKDGIKDTPIFRQALVTHEGTIQTSPTEAIHYHTYLYYLQRLGLMTGFMQILNPYCIRRGSGEAVEAVGTQAQLQQVMQHIDAATYQAYINQRVQCDTVAAFLGRPSNKALLKAAGHMRRSVDPRAPTQASTVKLNEIETDTTLAKLIELRDSLSSEVRRESGTIKGAESTGTKLYQMYRTVESKVRSTRAYLRKLAKTATRKECFDTISITEINAQLRNDADLDAGDWQPQTDHGLSERRMLAELIIADTSMLDGSTRLQHRLYTTHAMLSLGVRKEARAPKSAPKLNAPCRPQKCEKDQCFMCFWNEGIAPNQRFRKFYSHYRSRDHLLSQHLKNIGQRFVQCPAPQCAEKKAIFHTLPSLQRHLAEHHDYDIFKGYKGQ